MAIARLLVTAIAVVVVISISVMISATGADTWQHPPPLSCLAACPDHESAATNLARVVGGLEVALGVIGFFLAVILALGADWGRVATAILYGLLAGTRLADIPIPFGDQYGDARVLTTAACVVASLLALATLALRPARPPQPDSPAPQDP
ncbi:MAG: hypothetical protein WAT58_07650 [Candidatus Dormiibacterota bacterium]